MQVIHCSSPKVTWFYSGWETYGLAAKMAEPGVERALIRDRDDYLVGCVELQELKTPVTMLWLHSGAGVLMLPVGVG